MAASKTKLIAVLAMGGALLIAAIVLRPRPDDSPDMPGADEASRSPIHENFSPPTPREDLTPQEQARLEEIRKEASAARERIAVLNRELVHARGAVMRTQPEARAAVQRRQAAQQRRAAAVASDVELAGMRTKIAELNKTRADLRLQFSSLNEHASHSRPGEDGAAPEPVAGCYFCEEWDPASVEPLTEDPHTHADGRLYACCGPIPTEPLDIEKYRLLQRERRVLDDLREANASHATVLRRLEAEPEVAAAIAEARAADSDLQKIVQADSKVVELVRERDGLSKKSMDLAREQAGIRYVRPDGQRVVSKRTETP
jgi:hypothetical protein